MSSVSKCDLVLSGGFGTSSNSARAGFLPICLQRAPLAAFDGIPVYIRTLGGADDRAGSGGERFTLYCSGEIPFTQFHRERLIEHGAKFVYIPISHQQRFRQQTEASLQATIQDPSISAAVKSELLYETSVELVNELLADPDLAGKSARLEMICRAVATLVLDDQGTFSHLFAASNHDFYTATHMVNVATWMVPLAYALGHRDPEDLSQICRGGLLHDIGKIRIPADVLNKKGILSSAEWETIRRHPLSGCEHLRKFDNISPLVHRIVAEHHERLDGSGYCMGLRGDQIHPFSRICAVVDSFDAMTAFRPFKQRTMSVAQATAMILSETPRRYDPAVVRAWIGLLQQTETREPILQPFANRGIINHREFPRFPIHCHAKIHILQFVPGRGWVPESGLDVVAHNISRSGVGLLSQCKIDIGDQVRLHLEGRQTLCRTDEGLIVRCRNYHDGWYELGMRFESLSDRGNIDAAGLNTSAADHLA